MITYSRGKPSNKSCCEKSTVQNIKGST